MTRKQRKTRAELTVEERKKIWALYAVINHGVNVIIDKIKTQRGELSLAKFKTEDKICLDTYIMWKLRSWYRELKVKAFTLKYEIETAKTSIEKYKSSTGWPCVIIKYEYDHVDKEIEFPVIGNRTLRKKHKGEYITVKKQRAR